MAHLEERGDKKPKLHLSVAEYERVATLAEDCWRLAKAGFKEQADRKFIDGMASILGVDTANKCKGKKVDFYVHEDVEPQFRN